MLLDQISTASFTAVDISHNSADFTGGGVVMFQAGSVLISDSSISSNTAPMGGGMAVDSTTMAMQGVIFEGNVAGQGTAAAAAVNELVRDGASQPHCCVLLGI